MTLETMGLGLNVCMHRPSDLTFQHAIHAIPFLLSLCRILGSRNDVGNINLLHLLLRLPGASTCCTAAAAAQKELYLGGRKAPQRSVLMR
jgi:hypothetical protein